MKIQELLDRKSSRPLVTIAPTATLRELVAQLCEQRIGALIVSDDSNPILGIISERDIVKQCNKDVDFNTVTVGDAMTRDVVTVAPEYDIKVAMETMCTARVRHLPVVSDSEVLGIVTIGDVVKTMRDIDESQFVGFLSRFADKEASA